MTTMSIPTEPEKTRSQQIRNKIQHRLWSILFLSKQRHV